MNAFAAPLLKLRVSGYLDTCCYILFPLSWYSDSVTLPLLLLGESSMIYGTGGVIWANDAAIPRAGLQLKRIQLQMTLIIGYDVFKSWQQIALWYWNARVTDSLTSPTMVLSTVRESSISNMHYKQDLASIQGVRLDATKFGQSNKWNVPKSEVFTQPVSPQPLQGLVPKETLHLQVDDLQLVIASGGDCKTVCVVN